MAFIGKSHLCGFAIAQICQLSVLNGKLPYYCGGKNVIQGRSYQQPFNTGVQAKFSVDTFSDHYSERRGKRPSGNKKYRRRGPNFNDCRTIEEAIEIAFQHFQQGKLSPPGTAAFWSKVPRLLGKNTHRRHRTNELQSANQLEQIIRHTRKRIKSYNQRQISEIIFGLAKTFNQITLEKNKGKNSPIYKVLRDLLTPGNPDERDGIFNEMASASLSSLSKAEPRHLSNQAYAFSKIGRVPRFKDGTSFIDHIAEESILQMKNFNAQDISNLVLAFVYLGESNPKLFEKIGDTISAVGSVGASNPHALQREGNEIVHSESLRDFKPQNIANTVWTFATVGAAHTGLFQRIGNEIVGRENLNEFMPQNLANTVWAFAKVGESHLGLFQKVGDEIASLDNLHNYNPQNLANIVWSYATAQVTHPDLFKKVAREIVALVDLGSFNAQEISNIAWAFATAKQYYPELFDKISIAASQRRSELNPQNISNLLWAFSTVGRLHDDIFSSLAPSVVDLIDKFNCQNLANIAWVYSVSNVEAPCIFNKDGPFIKACLDAKNGFTAGSLAQMHQWQLWQRELGTGVALPDRLMHRCKWAFKTQGPTFSKLQKDVISELVAIGLHPEERVWLGSGYRIDALVEVHGEKVAVEIDGQNHFIGKNPTGSTILKRRQVSALDGVRVVSLPYWKWNDLGWNREYLRSKLFFEGDLPT